MIGLISGKWLDLGVAQIWEWSRKDFMATPSTLGCCQSPPLWKEVRMKNGIYEWSYKMDF